MHFVPDGVEFKRLQRRELFLEALEASGVDNWAFYDDARELYREWLKEEEDLNDDEE